MNEKTIPFKKDEDPTAYAKAANSGILLGYPVTINGQHSRSDNGIHYHSTIKAFEPEKDHPHVIHNLARNLPLNPPDAKNTQIEPGQFKDKKGNDVFVIKLHGNSAAKIKEHNGKFAHMGSPQPYEFQPHISVDRATWDKIKSSGAKTAHEAGITFGNAHLKRGPKVLKTYHHQADTTEPVVPDESDYTAKIGKSELQKGALKNAGIALGMAGALAGSHTSDAGSRAPASISHSKHDSYDRKKMLNAISQVESSGGTNTNHKSTAAGETAYGKYALMPNTIKDTIKAHKDLKTKYAKALALSGENLHRYMQDNKGLEDVIADRRLAHMEHRLSNNPDLISHAWLNGIQGTLDAKNKGEDIKNHWYPTRIRSFYGKR